MPRTARCSATSSLVSYAAAEVADPRSQLPDRGGASPALSLGGQYATRRAIPISTGATMHRQAKIDGRTLTTLLHNPPLPAPYAKLPTATAPASPPPAAVSSRTTRAQPRGRRCAVSRNVTRLNSPSKRWNAVDTPVRLGPFSCQFQSPSSTGTARGQVQGDKTRIRNQPKTLVTSRERNQISYGRKIESPTHQPPRRVNTRNATSMVITAIRIFLLSQRCNA